MMSEEDTGSGGWLPSLFRIKKIEQVVGINLVIGGSGSRKNGTKHLTHLQLDERLKGLEVKVDDIQKTLADWSCAHKRCS